MSSFKGISADELPLDEDVYTFVHSETGEATHIAASTLLKVIKHSGIVPQIVGMGQSLIDAIERGDLNVEEEHAWALPDEALDQPILVGDWGDKHIIIDGSHRLWRRYKRGLRDFPAYCIPEEAWRYFVIYGIPGDGEFWDSFNRNVKVRGR